jgi:Protein phosphatase 2C
MDALPIWRAIGKTVRGASHILTNLPNQDAINWWIGSPEGVPLIMSISDGHGSERYFRSNRGSRFAVQATTQVLKNFIESLPEPKDLAQVGQLAEELIPEAILQAWENLVRADLTSQPFADEEFTRLIEKRGRAARDKAEQDPLVAYGATVLSVAATATFIIYLQLGDGDILCVDPSGKTTRPYPRDERLIGNETTSLCTLDPADFRLWVAPASHNEPALIMLASDGYSNSYPDEEKFLRTGITYLKAARSEGMDSVNASLDRTLEYTSSHGSGDDIAMGILKRSELLDYDHLMTRFALVESSIASLRSDVSSIVGQTDFRTQLEQINTRFNTVAGSLAQMDIQTQSLQEVLQHLETISNGDLRPQPDLEKRLDMVENHQVAIDGRQGKLEQVYSELQAGLEDYHQSITSELTNRQEQVDALLSKSQLLGQQLEEYKQRIKSIYERIQRQEQASAAFEARQAAMQRRLTWLQIALVIVAGLAAVALGLVIRLLK